MTETLILAAIGLQATYETQTMEDTDTNITSNLHYLRDRIVNNRLKVEDGVKAIDYIWNYRYKHQAFIHFKEAMEVKKNNSHYSILSMFNAMRERLWVGYGVLLNQSLSEHYTVQFGKDKDGRLIEALFNCIWLEIYRTKKAPIKDIKVIVSFANSEVKLYHNSYVDMGSKAITLAQTIAKYLGKGFSLFSEPSNIEGYLHCFTLTLP
jgi:hypothetical protein